jgi:energy-coupling factor transporter ATP-binding protein EcfA2
MSELYRLDQIRFSYLKNQVVLDIPKLEIATNKVTAIQGSNGAGKSTLLKLLAFLERPQQGSIRFCGKKLSTTVLLSSRRSVSLVAQKPYLLRGTIFENVLLGLKFRGVPAPLAQKQVIDALTKTGIAAFADKPAAHLSGGEAQKVALARALALQPKVLLLDEPFNHLDQASIENLRHLIADFASQDGHSVIFTTHDQLLADMLASGVVRISASGQVISG